MALDDIKKINDEINKLRAELGKKPLKPFDENDLERAKSLLSGLSAEVREMGNDLDYVYKSFKDSVNELSKQNRYLSDSRKSLNGISDISKKIIDYRRGETSLDEKTLQNLKKKASSQFNELQRIKDIGNLSEKNRGEVEKALADQELFNEEVDKTIAAQKEVNKQIGLVGTGIEGISKGLSKMGFGNLSQPLTEAIQKTKDVRLQMELNKNVINDINKLQEFQNKGYQNLSFSEKNLYSQLKLRYSTDKDAQEKQKESLKSQNTELSTQTSKYKNIGIALKDQLTTANLIDFAIQQMVSALIKADTQTGQLAKAFGTSYSEATSMRNELNTVANLSGDVNITTGALQESLIAVNKEFGTATMLSGELLTDFTNMTKVMGYTDEAAAKLSKITTATGTDLSDNTAQILGTAAAFNVTNDLALNEKEIVEGVAKASAAVTVSLNMQPKAIAAAVIQAKALGLELEQVEGIAKSLLNFESSISNELEAELLTGRSLNLEQARYYALTNNVEGVAREIAKQGITAAEYTGMNSIAAEALAKSLGLSREELAQSLINQEALNKAGMTGKTTQEAYAALKEKGLSDDQIAEKLGNKILARQMKSQSVQDRFNASIEKLQELFVSVAEPILQIVSPFMDLLTFVLPGITASMQFLLYPVKLLGEGINGIINSFKTGENILENMAKILFGIVSTTILYRSVMLGINLAEKAKLGLDKQELLLGKSKLMQLAAQAVAWAIANPIMALAGLAAAGLVGAAVYSAVSKGDDIMSPGNNTSGYGERTLFGPEGAIQLNNKDTVIAGTNLFGNTAQSITSPTITINTDPLAREMQAVTKALEKLFDKDSNVYLDGALIGKGIKQARTKIG
jgi:transcriptional regulator with XRE-family HTH domain